MAIGKNSVDGRKKVLSPNLIFLIIFTAVVVFSSVFVTNSINDRIINANIDSMKELALHDERSIRSAVTLRWENMEGIARELSLKQFSNPSELMHSLKESLSYIPSADQLALLDTDGDLYTSRDLVRKNSYLHTICSDKTKRFVLRINTATSFAETSREVIIEAVPVDITAGDCSFDWLICTIPIETIERELKISSYGGEGYSSVIDRDGNYIINISRTHSFLIYDNFFEDLKDAVFRGKDTIEDLRSGAWTKAPKSIIYTVDDVENIMVITALDFADWYFITTVPTSVFKSETNSIMERVTILLVIIAVVIALVLALVFHQKNQQAAYQIAEAANTSKTEFLFTMSHDIRTPMNAIIGFSSIARKNLDDRDKLTDCLNKIQQSSALLLSLFNSMLDMIRIDSGNIEPMNIPGDVYFSFVNIESTVFEMAHMKNIDLSFNFGNITDRYVYADQDRCSRVFLNILSNAVKYTKEGGWIIVTCMQTEKRNDGYGVYRYTFQDNGIGMSEEFQKHLFERFSREENTTVSGIQGTGLGMAVAWSYVTMMHGTIECQSKQGVGTTITVTLPFKIQEDEAQHQFMDPVTRVLKSVSAEDAEAAVAGTVTGTVTGAAAIQKKSLKGKRVLLVEDNELNRIIAEDILDEEGMYVETAEDGSIAVAMMQSKGPKYYDCILMDIQMPVMDGYEATRRIRSMFPDSSLPIIAVSANASDEDRKASMESGMNDHIAKPINIKEFLSCLARYM